MDEEGFTSLKMVSSMIRSLKAVRLSVDGLSHGRGRGEVDRLLIVALGYCNPGNLNWSLMLSVRMRRMKSAFRLEWNCFPPRCTLPRPHKPLVLSDR